MFDNVSLKRFQPLQFQREQIGKIPRADLATETALRDTELVEESHDQFLDRELNLGQLKLQANVIEFEMLD